MIFCHNLKVLFISVPKAASETMDHVLKENFGGTTDGTERHAVHVPATCEHYFKYAVVRNPYDRLVSVWMYASRKRRHRAHPAAKSMDFAEFVKWMADPDMQPSARQKRRDLKYLHFRGRDIPQFAFLKLCPQFDRLLRFEDLERDFHSLPFVTESTTLLRRNARKDRRRWRELYTPEIARNAYKYAALDFEYLGYDACDPYDVYSEASK